MTNTQLSGNLVAIEFLMGWDRSKSSGLWRPYPLSNTVGHVLKGWVEYGKGRS